ncbi:MAG: UDP-N-acetyl-D-glucosamine 2-epimerase, UDP-hydrolysing [Candidatus Epulonipiscioides saccharophilum]|nr:MAG: UDP-N-acetyl-D-glucosamine 2-epimerase, UDP-hydrolysing [Epulopiscium sp. AS2M-Bin001]
MKKIMVVTATRAEYGLLKNVIRQIYESDELELILIVTGTHLNEQYGFTVQEIESDLVPISLKISMDVGSNEKTAIVKSMANLMNELAEAMDSLKPDMLLILGDRYEMLACASAATIMNVPIAHIAGGEVSYGANDEQIRHAITKMAHIHFPEADVYAKNITFMGEEKFRVKQVGALGIENIITTKLLSHNQLNQQLGLKVDNSTFLITYHPTTLFNNLVYEMDQLLEALDSFDNNMIITYPNSDNGGEYIIERLKDFANSHSNVFLFQSLGLQAYLSTMRYCGVVIGNSSSALIEAPVFKKAVVNIGKRQSGRLMASNIISCSNDKQDIIKAINKALSPAFHESLEQTLSLYGIGNTSEQIVSILEDLEIDEKFITKKLIF